MPRLATVPQGLSAALTVEYIDEYYNEYDKLWKEATIINLKTTLVVVAIILLTAAWMTGGIYLAAACHLNNLCMTITIFGTAAGGFVGIVLASVVGIKRDMPAYMIWDKIGQLNQVLEAKYKLKKTLGPLANQASI